MRLFHVLYACVALSVSAADAAPAPGLDVSGPGPHLARYLLTHPDAATRFAALRANPVRAGAMPPALIAGDITTRTVNVLTAPAAPAVRIKYSAPGILAQAYFYFESPSGQSYAINFELNSPVARAGTITFQDPFNPFGLYSVPATWTLIEADLIDKSGNSTSYLAGDLTPLFSSLTFALTNEGAPDGVPPSFSTGEILTPKVHLGSKAPYFGATLNVADNSSGVAAAYILLNDPDHALYEAYAILPAPLKSGSATAYLQFAPNEKYQPGTWTITGIEVFDVAGNYVSDMAEADIRAAFGTTTFKVVN